MNEFVKIIVCVPLYVLRICLLITDLCNKAGGHVVFIIIQVESLVSMFREMGRSHEVIVRRVMKMLLNFIQPAVKCLLLEEMTVI